MVNKMGNNEKNSTENGYRDSSDKNIIVSVNSGGKVSAKSDSDEDCSLNELTDSELSAFSQNNHEADEEDSQEDSDSERNLLVRKWGALSTGNRLHFLQYCVDPVDRADNYCYRGIPALLQPDGY